MKKGTTVLIARIYPHAAAFFFPNSIADFTNHSLDLNAVLGRASDELYETVMQAGSIEEQVGVLDRFFVRQLEKSKVRHQKVTVVREICHRISAAEGEPFNISALADQYGISERYIQKLFLDHVGLTPRSFFQIQRFNQSLQFTHPSFSSKGPAQRTAILIRKRTSGVTIANNPDSPRWVVC